MGKVATSPLPSRGSPPLQSGGGGIEKWPTCGQSGYVTPAISGIPTASERGGKSEVAHKWAKWLHHPCRLGDPQRFTAGGEIQKWPTSGQTGYVTPAVSGIPSASERGGGGNSGVTHLWAKGYVTPAVSGIPTASEQRARSEVAHLWAKWLRHPCNLGDPQRFRAGGKIRSGPQVGKVATSPLPSRGSPPLQSKGQTQKWPTCGQSGYVTPTVSGIPTASERGGGGGDSEMAHLWAKWLRHPSRLGDPHRFRAGGGGDIQKWPTCGPTGYATPAVSGIPTASEQGAKSEVAHKWAKWLRHPYRLGDPHRFRAGGGGGGGIQKWPTCGQSGYVTPPASGIPTASERGGNSKVAHKWAKWLRHPCRLGDPHRFRARGKLTSGPLVGKVATSPLPSRGSPPLQSGGGGGGFRNGPLVGKVATSPLPPRGSPPLQSGGGGIFRSGPLVGQLATPPLPSRGSPSLQSRGQNQKWPTCGQSGYITPAVSRIPTASPRGGKSEVAHLWAKWLRHPCRLGDPHSFRAGGGGGQKWSTSGQSDYITPAISGIPTASHWGGGGKFRSGPQVGKVATSPLPSRGSPPLQSGGENQKWPTCGQSGYVTPAVSGIPSASEQGAKSEVAHKWAKWLRHPYRLGDPHRFRAGGKIRSGPLVGKVATSPLPSRGSPPLQSGGQNQKWPTSGQGGYVTPAVSGIPTAAELR